MTRRLRAPLAGCALHGYMFGSQAPSGMAATSNRSTRIRSEAPSTSVRRALWRPGTGRLQCRPATNGRGIRAGPYFFPHSGVPSHPYDVPVNAVFFRNFKDGQAEYLARTWLRPAEETTTERQTKASKGRPWNARDYYVVLRRVDHHNRWPPLPQVRLRLGKRWSVVHEAASKSALRQPSVCLRRRADYVGIGIVTGGPVRLRDAVASGDVKLNAADVPDWEAAYRDAHDDDMTTWIVPVAWDATRNETNAVRRHQIRLIETHRHPAEPMECSHPSGASLLDPISPSQGPIVPARRASACLRHATTPQDKIAVDRR